MFYLLYVVGALACWIPFAVGFLRSVGGAYGYDSTDYVFGVILGGLTAAVWPVSLIVLGVSHLVRRAVEAEVKDWADD